MTQLLMCACGKPAKNYTKAKGAKNAARVCKKCYKDSKKPKEAS